MKNIARSRFAITSWDEKPYHEGPDQPRLTRASVTKTYTGDIEGEGHVLSHNTVYNAGRALCQSVDCS